MKLTAVLERTLLALAIAVHCVAMEDPGENCGQSTSEVCEAPPLTGVASSSASLAVVPYDEKILTVPDFHLAERRLRFAEFTVTIGQNWQEVGVAAVVWDAVGFG